MDHAGKAREIIAHVPYMTVASVSAEGGPWNTPVFFGFDDAYNLYWASWVGSRHSRNIAANPRVLIVIYDTAAPEGTGLGVYIEATAQALTETADIERACRCAYRRAGKEPPGPEAFMGERARRMYRAVPERVWVNTTRSVDGEWVDDRIEVKLAD